MAELPDSNQRALYHQGRMKGRNSGRQSYKAELPDNGAEMPDSSIKITDSRAEKPDSKVKIPDSKVKIPDSKAELLDMTSSDYLNEVSGFNNSPLLISDTAWAALMSRL